MVDLVIRAKNGDAEAFAELYGMYGTKLYSTAYYLLGRKEDAEDIVMETISDAFVSIGKLRNPEAFGAWIYRILMNKLKRKRKYYIDEPENLDDYELPAREALTDEQLAVRNALRLLEPESREVVLLSVLSGYKSEEIAVMLGLNANTVRSKKQRALTRLKEVLE